MLVVGAYSRAFGMIMVPLLLTKNCSEFAGAAEVISELVKPIFAAIDSNGDGGLDRFSHILVHIQSPRPDVE